MASLKTAVIENLFFERFDADTGAVSDPIVTLEQVSDAIRRWGRPPGVTPLSDRNPANFMKDVVRSPTRNGVFPRSVVDAGYTARQDTARGRCFEFRRLPPGQTTAFIENEPDFAMVSSPHRLQSVTLPPAARDFGRSQETWLTHVATQLGVIPAHLALHSALPFIGVELLQTNVGFGEAEVDALYLGELADGENVLICCEMKGASDVLDEDQIERGARRVAETAHAPTDVVPLGVKILLGGLIWVVEFETQLPLQKATEGVYELFPAVPGID